MLRADTQAYFGHDPGRRRVGDKMFDGVIPLGEALRPLDLFRRCTRVACPQQSFGSRPRRIGVNEGDDARERRRLVLVVPPQPELAAELRCRSPGSSGKDTGLLGCWRDRQAAAAA